jgi:hypothetical protein
MKETGEQEKDFLFLSATILDAPTNWGGHDIKGVSSRRK